MGEAQGLYSQGRDDSGLTKREREVLRLLHGVGTNPPMSQLQVSEKLGISRQRVRQIVENLIKKGHDVPGAKPPPTPKPEETKKVEEEDG